MEEKKDEKVKTSIDVTLDVIGGKWKLVILCVLMNDTMRTSELLRAIPRISQRMLIQQLKELEQDMIINRRSYNEIPPRVEYSLTEYGKTLVPIMKLLSKWGETHVQEIYPKKGIEFRIEK